MASAYTLLLVASLVSDKPETFCTNWNSGTPAQKIKFLLEPEPKLLNHLKEKGLSDGNIATFKVCFEENIVRLRDVLDKDCRVEDALSRFFQAQVDTSDQEFQHINDYINMCTIPEGTQT